MKIKMALVFVALAFGGYSQNLPVETAQIENEVAGINHLKCEIQSYSYRNTCGVTEGIVKCYSWNGAIVKITDAGKGDDDRAAGKWRYQYYYKNGLLICSQQTTTFFNNETGNNTTSDIKEYYSADRLLKKIEDKKTSYPPGTVIGQDDIRYRLKGIKKAADLDAIYGCPE